VSWIVSITYQQSRGLLRKLYEQLKGEQDYLDNVLTVHGLRPHTLGGHLSLYRSVLHHPANRLPVWHRELAGWYVSWLNGCAYCVAHHRQGVFAAAPERSVAEAIMEACEQGELSWVGEPLTSMLGYVAKLTREPGKMTRADVQALRAVGMDDGSILELNQVAAYFAYVNRTVQGLGVSLRGDRPGWTPPAGDEEAEQEGEDKDKGPEA